MNSTETSPSTNVLKKSRSEEFDLVILGGGTGSTVAAWIFAGEGKRVAVVDRKYIGGSCPNIACKSPMPHRPQLFSHMVEKSLARPHGFQRVLGFGCHFSR